MLNKDTARKFTEKREREITKSGGDGGKRHKDLDEFSNPQVLDEGPEDFCPNIGVSRGSNIIFTAVLSIVKLAISMHRKKHLKGGINHITVVTSRHEKDPGHQYCSRNLMVIMGSECMPNTAWRPGLGHTKTGTSVSRTKRKIRL